jgi:hypothetical protein
VHINHQWPMTSNPIIMATLDSIVTPYSCSLAFADRPSSQRPPTTEYRRHLTASQQHEKIIVNVRTHNGFLVIVVRRS